MSYEAKLVLRAEYVEGCLEHLQRLEMAGVKRPDLDFGPTVIVWTQKRDGNETWEILPDWVAELAVSEFCHDPTVARAVIYRRIPAHCPMPIAQAWLLSRVESWQLIGEDRVLSPPYAA